MEAKNSTTPGSYLLRTVSIICLTICLLTHAFGQTEVEPWGNITGIRVGGQLMNFETSIQVVSNHFATIQKTALEKQKPKYHREGNTQMVSTRIDSFYFTEAIEENIPASTASVSVQYTAKKSTDSAQLYFGIEVSQADFYKGKIQFLQPNNQAPSEYAITHVHSRKVIETSGILFTSAKRRLKVMLTKPVPVIFAENTNKNSSVIQVFIPLQYGVIKEGETGTTLISIQASGVVDKSNVHLHLNTKDTGRMFAGFGGNFRLQNPTTDPQVIDFCLNNMRVAWARVEMPLQLWQPALNSNPIDSAKAGKLHPHVKESMEMAARLGKMGIPVIVTAWSAPRWAITGDVSYGPRPDGVWGNPLDTTHLSAIYKSIADYLIYLRDEYGVEAKMFSFNESDLGINIRQTGEEHAQLIKGLGAYFVSRGLHTKMLLGDNSDANSYAFIYPAMKDPETYPYIGAISFHSWRGWEKETLQKWADAATQLKLPLIVGEGSIDAAAYTYPAIFQEQTYAVKEINLYTRLMAICQPLTILQWQLTADYSPLIGGGIFGNNEPLHPGQRFWNLKQLSSIPKNLLAMPIATDKPYISCAAQGNNKLHQYAIHIVNDGATRTAVITGLPVALHTLNAFVTSKELSMQKQELSVKNGEATLSLPTESYTTLVSE